MKPAFLLLTVMAFFATSIFAADSPTEAIYQKILQTGGLNDKISLGKKLGLLQTPEARAALIRLMEEDHYWDRIAALNGLAFYKDAEVLRLLARKLDDHMVSDNIEALAPRSPEDFSPYLCEVYPGLTVATKQADLIKLIGQMKTQSASNFLAKLIEGPKDSMRVNALKALVENFPGNVNLARSKVRDPELRDACLSLLVELGNKDDLPVFLGMLDGREAGGTARVLAYQAVSRWGDEALKLKTCLAALKETDGALIQGALLTFKSLTNDQVFGEVCRLTRQGPTSKIRLLAAENLCNTPRPESWPYLISTLKETYVPERQTGYMDIFISVVTVGISSVFEKLNASYSKNEFEARKSRILDALKKQTRAYPGATYEDWRDWAVEKGMTVDGVNLIQALWNADPSRRDSAVLAAIRILGYQDLSGFLKSRANQPALTDTELRLELARLLEKKGVLKDDKF
ncbi:MAG: HEAT repeat domain-containing protein [Spirochaetia bacterium]|nr:HEAT repeat domain-containing protein [Spirochaetia bacterium]